MSQPCLEPLLSILAVIAGEEHADPDRVREVTGLSPRAIREHLRSAREYGVIIEESGERGRYIIRSWGEINPAWITHS